MKGSPYETNDLEFYSGMALKWYWVVLLTVGFATLFGIYRVQTSQRYYEARTVILVQPQKLPTDVVRNIVAEDINTRVSILSQRIRSRTNLEKIIREFQLFEGDAYRNMYMEDKVESLRSRISVKLTNGLNRNADSFAVTYKGTDPVRVTKITQSLASNIIDENLRLRETKVLGTNSFLEDELEAMRKKLVATETRLKVYRESYMGGLPEQLNSNLSILDSLSERLNHVRDEIRSAKDRLAIFLQRSNLSPAPVDEVPPGVVDRELELNRLRSELKFRMKRYTEHHPDVLQLQAAIRQLEAEPPESSPLKPPARTGDTELERQRFALQTEILVNEKERETLQKQIAIYKKRVEDTPKREQELLSLQRDYDNIRSAYHSLLNRQLEAQIAVNMERKQKGEQFRIIDPARVPEKPVEPDMKKLVLIVLAAGLGLGFALVALLEIFMQTFRGSSSVELYTSVPVIASIPTIHHHGNDLNRFFVKRVFPVAGGLVTVSLVGVFLGLAYIKG